MSKDERYDFVVVGGGPNGIALAAYLGKCGASVCVLEERPEAGGACENSEPIPGVRLTPHAMYMYAGPAPGFEQLELHKYGFRMDWSPISENLANQKEGGVLTTEGVAPLTDKDVMGWAKLAGMLGQPPFIKDLLRATFWCPPHPPEVEVTAENIPYMQVYKQHQPDVWTAKPSPPRSNTPWWPGTRARRGTGRGWPSPRSDATSRSPSTVESASLAAACTAISTP
jgi:hypothetical protein